MKQAQKHIKNVMLSSPAGSGKTSALTERFVNLLLSMEHPDPRRILAMTFTNDAASEMRRRIVQKIRDEHPELYKKIYRNLAHLRIQTFHSFSKRLVERFAFELGYDPGLKVIESPKLVFKFVFMKRVLMALFDEDEELARYISDSPTKLADLERQLTKYLEYRPRWEFMNKEQKIDDIENLDLFQHLLNEFLKHKQSMGLIDFSDMEVMAYNLLYNHPQWALVLEAFDEVTDHLLVDEFQDTNLLQWALISKLTEEWRAGLGAKAERGITPTIFIVGDENQSIYMFRGANVEVFKNAKKELESFYADDFQFIVSNNNYRSLQSIIEFVNFVFQKLFTGGDKDSPWKTKYHPFVRSRNIESPGNVTILNISAPEYIKKIGDLRPLEAEVIAKWILYFKENGVVYENDGTPRKPEFRDFAILIRSRRRGFYEPTLSRYNIPYNSLVETGFFEEPEIQTLLALLKLIIFPIDTNSVFQIILSPMRQLIDENSLVEFLSLLLINRHEAISYFKKSLKPLREFMSSRDRVPLALALDKLLIDSGFYRFLDTPQSQLNIEKFLDMVMEYDAQGYSWREIAKTLVQSETSEMKKPQVIDPELNAVTITTIHGAKGLQWPVVIVPSLSWLASQRIDRFGFIEKFDSIDGYKTFLTDDTAILKSKLVEEEKRILYVAYTRAMDALAITFIPNYTSRYIPLSLLFLRECLNESMDEISKIPGVELIDPDKLHVDTVKKPEGKILPAKKIELEHTEPIELKPYPEIKYMSTGVPHPEKETEYKWIVFGNVFHEGIALYLMGRISDQQQLLEWAQEQFKTRIWEKETQAELLREFERHFQNLKNAEIVGEIIQKKSNAKIHVEFPVLLKKSDGSSYSGRIDLICLNTNDVSVFDYKTIPVNNNLESLVQMYQPQIENYKEALRLIYRLPVKGFLVFTDTGTTVEIQ